MRIVVQRVQQASVKKGGQVLGSINQGLLVLVGIAKGDDQQTAKKIGDQILHLRLFPSKQKDIDRSVEEVQGELLIVPQFTLCTNDKKSGRRPSFTKAASPQKAKSLYQFLLQYLQEQSSLKVESGQFGAYMQVELINDGPVTIIAEE